MVLIEACGTINKMIRTLKLPLPGFSDERMVREGMRLCDWYLEQIAALDSTHQGYLHRQTYVQAKQRSSLLKSALVQCVLRRAIATVTPESCGRGKPECGRPSLLG